VIGALLIALGIAGLLIDSIQFRDKRTVIDAGPIKVTEERQHSVSIPTIAGVIAVVAGAALVFLRPPAAQLERIVRRVSNE